MADPAFDLAVVGGGMAGLAAALAAAEQGARAVVLEGSAETGGNARIAAGMFLGARDAAGLHAYVPDGDRALQRLVAGEYDGAVGWLERLGLPIGPTIERRDFRKVRPMGAGEPGARGPFMALLAARARERGVAVRTGARVLDVARSGTGYRARTSAGAIEARAAVLATGGFAAGRDMQRRFLGPDAANLMIRSLPGAQGDGLRFAEALGAATQGDMAAFYGHTEPDCPLAPSEWQPITPYFARLGVLLNRDGRRFVDESPSLLEELNPQAGFRQPGGRYWMVIDERIRLGEGDEAGPDAVLPGLDWLDRIRRAKAPLVVAPTLAELCAGLAGEGIDAAAALAELTRFNGACREGAAARLAPPRRLNARPIERPPFYALRCVAAITATCGGIAIDDRCRVLDRSRAPIPGLFAAGVDAGGVYGRTYGGFLAWSLVSGRRAGLTAATALARGGAMR